MTHEELIKRLRKWRPEMLTEQDTGEAADRIEQQAEKLRIAEEALSKYKDNVLFYISIVSPYRAIAKEYFEYIKPVLAKLREE